MSKKDSDKGNVVDLLKSEHFGMPGISTPDSGDPVMETTMVLTLDQLVEYDGNPRNAPNSEYEALKASYLKTGAANTLLVVTKRPGEEFYFPAAGGNTRLRVLRELWDELRDERFYRINCKFIPFKDETRVLVDHLTENVNRGDYIFIDHAKGVMKVYDQMKNELDGTLSYREFIRKVGDLGYKLSPAQLSRFQNGVDLYEHIPQALDAGMHIRAVIRLKDTHKDLKEFLDSACGGNPAIISEFDRFWEFILQDMDSPEGIDQDTLVNRIFESLAPTASERVPELDDGQIVARLKHRWPLWREDNSISVSLRQGEATRRDGTDSSRPGPAHRYSDHEKEDFSRERFGTGFDNPGSDFGSDDKSHGQDRPDSPPGTSESSSETGSYPASTEGASVNTPPVHRDTLNFPGQSSGTTDSIERKKLELDRLYLDSSKYAQPIAESWDLDDLFHSIGSLGSGYFVDLPEQDHNLNSFSRIAWWLLWDISGVSAQSITIPQYLDDAFKGTRIARNWSAIADGRASVKKQELDALPPDGRNATILKIFKHVVNSTISRSDEHATFLVAMEPAQYQAWTAFLNLHRKTYAIKLAIMEEMRARK